MPTKLLKKHWMLALLLIYAIWRCALPVYLDWNKFYGPGQENFIGPDWVYSELAKSILERGEYSLEPDGKPYGIRTPGYSLIVAGFMGVFGDNWAAGLAIFQAVCIVFAVLCIYIAGCKLRGPPVGALAGFLVASYAPYHFISCMLLRESICLALFAATMLLLIRGFYFKKSFIAMGVLVGVNAMLREEFILLVIPCFVAIFLGEFGGYKKILADIKTKWRKPGLKCLSILGIILIVFTPWIIRNAMVYKRFQMTGTLGGVQLFLGNNRMIRPFEYVYEYGFIAHIPEMRDHSDYEVGQIYGRRAVDFMLHNPDRLVVNAIGKFFITFENSMNKVNDFPFIMLGLFFGVFFGAHFKLSNRKTMLLALAFTIPLYIYWRSGFSLGLLVPNIEFGWLFRILGVLGFIYLLFRAKEIPLVLVFPVMFMVNLVFIPQHRHRWVTDWLFILWICIILRDMAIYIMNRQKLSGDIKHNSIETGSLDV